MANTTTTLGCNTNSERCRCFLLGTDMEKRHITCPYLYEVGTQSGKCKVSGGTTQSGHDFERYCLSGSAWLTCPNYLGRNKKMFP